MKFFDKLEQLHNMASETRFVWFPFLWLKPKNELEIMTFPKIIKMSFAFGLYYSLFAILKKFVFNGIFSITLMIQTIIIAIFIFFLWFHFVTAPIWNRRARRLKKISEFL